MAWGDSSYGQTARPVNLTNVVAVAAADYGNLILYHPNADLFIGPPPPLNVSLTNQQIVIFWPSRPLGFVLEEKTLLNATNWIGVAQTPSDNGTTRSLTLPIGSGAKFYHLKK